MKINGKLIKNVGKALAAAGAVVSGVILAAQSKKDMSENDFDATLEPLGNEELAEDVEAEIVETEEQEEEPEEDKDEED